MLFGNEYKPQIKVFVTKTQHIRARIKEIRDAPSYEVTVGGTEWHKGKGVQFQDQIKRKALKLAHRIMEEALSI